MMGDTFRAFEAHARQEAPRECCGLIVRGHHGEETYRPCRNVAPGLREFEIHHADWDAAEDVGEILAVCHSHPGGSALPGASDEAAIQQTGLPWYILGDILQRIDPSITLVGRPFIFGWSDCYAAARDWYLVHLGIRLPDYPREPIDHSQGHSAFTDQFRAFGFVEVEEALPGDLLLLGIHKRVTPDHVAVLLEGGTIFDHQRGRLSGSRPLGALAACITHRLRFVC